MGWWGGEGLDGVVFVDEEEGGEVVGDFTGGGGGVHGFLQYCGLGVE